MTVRDRQSQMEEALWYLLAGSRGSRNRLRLIRALSERPHNRNELADRLDVHYNTVDHHVELLEEHGVVEAGDEEYGRLYFLTDRFERHREAYEQITARLDADRDRGADLTVE